MVSATESGQWEHVPRLEIELNSEQKRIMMRQRKSLTNKLPRLLLLLTKAIGFDKTAVIIRQSDDFSALLLYAGRLSDTDDGLENRDLVDAFCAIADVREVAEWTPCHSMSFETGTDVALWFWAFLCAHFKRVDLTWEGKIGQAFAHLVKRI